MDLTTTYMGLKLNSPIVPSASPLSRDLANIKQMEDAGAGAVVLWSLFEEQIQHDAEELEFYLHYGTNRFAESLTYFPEPSEYHMPSEQYLQHIGKAKAAVDMPVIASLNGISAKGWTDFAKQMADAGADALELNVYFLPTNPAVTAEQVEDVYLSVLRAVKETVDIPVAMKLSPFFSATANMIARLDTEGADGLVLFNRFYQPDIDIANLEVRPKVYLSRSEDILLPLRWTAILHDNVDASLAATTGIHSGEDVAKVLMAGADVAMMCSALLRNGINVIGGATEELRTIMETKGYDSVEEMKGVLSQRNVAEPAAFERANYMKALSTFGRTATFE
ncbi:MAG: dihydroorotate dehydrogenase-like protein [Planctomycetota bacterium]